jgi:Uma2 family endonuclease
MTQPGIAVGHPSAPMTLAHWGELDEDEEGELVDGALEEEEMPYYLHEVVVGYLIVLLHAWVAGRNGIVGGSEAKFAVKPGRGRKADLSIYLDGRRPAARAGVIQLPPDIIVEVVSPRPRDARRDRVTKLDEYAAFGVRFYWIVDPQIRSLEIYERTSDGRYARALGAEAGRLSEVPGCAGLTLDLDALWREADKAEAVGDEPTGL